MFSIDSLTPPSGSYFNIHVHIYVDLATYVDINIYMLIWADQHIYVDLENQHLVKDYHEQESLRGVHSRSKCNTNF